VDSRVRASHEIHRLADEPVLLPSASIAAPPGRWSLRWVKCNRG
jgi:hypothetical protein